MNDWNKTLKEFEETLKRFNEIPLLIQEQNNSLISISERLDKLLEEK